MSHRARPHSRSLCSTCTFLKYVHVGNTDTEDNDLKRMRTHGPTHQNSCVQGCDKMNMDQQNCVQGCDKMTIPKLAFLVFFPFQLKMNVTQSGLMGVNTSASQDRNPTRAAVLRATGLVRTTNGVCPTVSAQTTAASSFQCQRPRPHPPSFCSTG